MAEIINMPRLSDTMEEGTVTKWFKKVGDQVKEGDILAEIETDKATMEFESFQEGEILHIGISEGDSAPVDSLLAIIGKKGEDVEVLRKKVATMMDLNLNNVKINIEEIRKPEINAQLVAEGIASQLERRIMYRRAMKRAVQNSMRLGVLGIKVNIAGRLNGAEIARSEWYREGRVPLHTLKAKIDYGFAEAMTTYGIIGIKTWIYSGETEEETTQEKKG